MPRWVFGQDQLLLICGCPGENILVLRGTRWITTYSEPEERIYFGLRRILCINSAEITYAVNLKTHKMNEGNIFRQIHVKTLFAMNVLALSRANDSLDIHCILSGYCLSKRWTVNFSVFQCFNISVRSSARTCNKNASVTMDSFFFKKKART